MSDIDSWADCNGSRQSIPPFEIVSPPQPAVAQL